TNNTSSIRAVICISGHADRGTLYRTAAAATASGDVFCQMLQHTDDDQDTEMERKDEQFTLAPWFAGWRAGRTKQAFIEPVWMTDWLLSLTRPLGRSLS